MKNGEIQIVECPRDAMQGIRHFIPTEKKVTYIQQLLKVGFHSLDFGSFVSPEMIPQMADTAKVLDKLDLSQSSSKLIAIMANERGAKDASLFPQIDALGYPFSISETFQLKNTNSTIQVSYDRVKAIAEIAQSKNKELIIYISMGFGNPYNDPYNPDITGEWIEKLSALGVKTFMLSDTIGIANPTLITYLFESLLPRFSNLQIGAHFHTAPHNWLEKIDAAYKAGCRRFDAALKGYGGCPMAKDELIGNMPTENLINYFNADQHGLNLHEFEESLRLVPNVFSS